MPDPGTEISGAEISDSGTSGAGQVFGIVVAAGAGSRFGGFKQLQLLCGVPVLRHALKPVLDFCDETVVVLPAELVDSASEHLGELEGMQFTVGGATRSESVRCGMAALARVGELPAELQSDPAANFGPDDIMLVHDAARPLASSELFESTLAAVRAGADCAVPAVPVTDTIRHETDGPIDRTPLRAVQTPQVFNARKLWQAHRGNPEATDDASLLEASGCRVELVAGDPLNLKVTHPADLTLAEAVLSQRESLNPREYLNPHESLGR